MATMETQPATKRVRGGSFLTEERRPQEVFTPEDLSDEHRQIAKTAAEFTANEVAPAAAEIEAKNFTVIRGLLRKAGELGLMAVDVPEAYGGLEMDKVTSAVISESVVKLASFAVAFSAHAGIGTLPLVWYGTPEQKRKYLPKLATGEWIASYALSESSSGSDAMNCRTRATLSADGREWVLNGEKMWITNAGFADLFTVFAKIDGEKFSAFLIERGTPGLSVGPEEHKLGIRGSSTCPLILADCRVPVENLLGEAGKGHHIAFNILNIGRFKLGAACVGGARSIFQEAILYARDRKAFGKSICEFGLIQEKLAECATGIYAGESLAYRTIGMIDAALADVEPGAEGAVARDPEAHRGVRRGVLHPQGLGIGDAGYGGGPRGPDLRRIRLRGGVSGRARLSRFAHQPDLRGHQRNQPPDHHRMADEAGDGGAIAAAGGHQAAYGRGDVRSGGRRGERRSPGRGAPDARRRQEADPVRGRRGLAKVHAGPGRCSRRSWARWPIASWRSTPWNPAFCGPRNCARPRAKRRPGRP